MAPFPNLMAFEWDGFDGGLEFVACLDFESGSGGGKGEKKEW
jgi:hypothetical protein